MWKKLFYGISFLTCWVPEGGAVASFSGGLLVEAIDAHKLTPGVLGLFLPL